MHTLPVSKAAERLGMTSSKIHLLVRRGDLELTPAETGMFEVTADSIDRYSETSSERAALRRSST
ncbi:hypothetical protein [Actinospongicola halichondriae]|uniref:hypothetical protein n=1 Tax=Actinospongicola halichondriae TaxID=3236844 RepID=UPI003D4BCB77